MGFLFPVLLMMIAAPAQTTAVPSHGARFTPSAQCPNASNHLARKGGAWRGDPAKPQKLGELPPADTYAAVYVRDERGCMVPVFYPGTSPRRR